MREVVERTLGRAVAAVRAQLPAEPDPINVAYGGANAIHACAIAGYAGLRRVIVTPFAAVSSAFGSSLLDVGHLYYRRVDAAAVSAAAETRLAEAIAQMRAEAERDMRGEGYADSVRLELQLHLQAGGAGPEIVVGTAQLSPAAALRDAIGAATAQLGAAPATVRVTTVALHASAAVPHVRLRPRDPIGTPVATARTGTREVLLEAGAPATPVPVFARERLGPGHRLDGPVLIDSAQTTLLVAAGWQLAIDGYDHAILEAAGQS
jgi:N-methylhydantoinase A/oxoprolinase/acetone carboxylase beta subunit